MSVRNSRAMLRRWKSPTYRNHMSAVIKSRYVPKIKVGTTPDPRRDLPPEVSQLLDSLADETLDVIECNPQPFKRTIAAWRISLIDGTEGRLKERFVPLVQAHGLD